MARISMRNVQKSTVEEYFNLYLSSAAAKGVKDKTLETYKNHFRSISKRMNTTVPMNRLTSQDLEEMMALSLRSKEPLKESDFHTNTLGRELNRQTITGDAEALYKCLMELYAGKHLTDDEFFPMHVNAHIDRGAIFLDQEQRYVGDFLVHLTELDKGL